MRAFIATALILCAFTGCQPTTAPPPAPPPNTKPTPPTEYTDLELKLVAAHNQVRIQHDVRSLNAHIQLMRAARKHAQWMSDNHTMSHTGAGGSNAGDRVRAEQYRWSTCGENIAAGYPSIDAVMVGWMQSAGHKKNILNKDYQEIGVGVVGRYWCVVFATSRSGTLADMQYDIYAVPAENLPPPLGYIPDVDKAAE